MLVVSNLQLPLGEPEETVFDAALRRLGLRREDAREIRMVKKSLDARRRSNVHFVCSVGILAQEEREAALAASGLAGVTRRQPPALELPRGTAPLAARPVVVGFGPAGMFAGLLLARCGFAPVILERGEPVEERVRTVEAFWRTGTLCPESNVQFGEGGAGTFSDGKLTTRIGDTRCEYVLAELARHGAPREILFSARPHIGTDRLRGVVRSIREEILSLGGEVRFGVQVQQLLVRGGQLCGVRTQQGELPASVLVLAVGHSARGLFESLHRAGIPMSPKPFSVGVRAEHRQCDIERGLYGALAGHPDLPRGEYQLSYRENGRGVYTFCMCPGGLVVPSASEEGGVVTNGMSEYARDRQNANSAVVVGVEPADFGGTVLGGIAFQRTLEQAAFLQGGGLYHAPAQTAGRFLQGKPGFTWGRVEPSYALGVAPGRFDELFPQTVSGMLRRGLQAFGRKLPGFDAPDTVLTGVETRTSSPVRIERDPETLLSAGAQGLYPCGEGAGYAGGIMSAAVDGIRVAQQIIARYAPAR